MIRNDAVKFVVVRSLGNFLLLFALYGVVATFGPVFIAETKFRIVQARGVSYEVQEETKGTNETKVKEPGFAEVMAGDKEQILIPKDTEFSILIAKIGASSKIFPNVDPANEKEFLDVLQHGVAHAKGSVFPGMPGNVYLFAHSVDNWWNVGRYNAVFYLLKDLSQGDEIVVFFENRRYDYIVSQKIISDPTDISFLTQDRLEQRLVLQTCWPPGTTWKRLYILATPK
jgi:sortase A